MHRATACSLVCILMLALFAPVVLAAETANTWSGEELLTPGTLSIDGAFNQDDMNAPYESGYAPAIEDGRLNVVLPLIASTRLDGDVIYCGLDLGSRENSPFRYQNYQSIPVRLFHPDPEAEDYDPYLYVARFSLPLSDDRKNGVYPLGVVIRYREDGQEKEQTFTIDFTVSDASSSAPPDEPGSDDPGGSPGYSDPGYSDPGYADPSAGGSSGGGGTSAEPSAEPKVILQQAVADPDPADAGTPFTVTCTLRNTSKKQRVSNMTVSYKSQTTDLIPLGGASTQYIEAIAPDSTIQFAFQMESRLDAQSGPQKIDLALGYDGADGATYTAADEITVQIRQRLRLEYDQPNFPSSVFIGDSISTGLNLFNKGKGTLYNVTVSLDMPGIEPESSSFVGNMESGTSKSADIYAQVVGLAASDEEEVIDVEVEEPSAAAEDGAAGEEAAAIAGAVAGDMSQAGSGETKGEFLITYEDEFGDISEKRIPVSTEIMAMDFYEDPMEGYEEPEEPESGFPWWGWALIGGGGAAAVAVPAAVRRKKKRVLALQEADDDELY